MPPRMVYFKNPVRVSEVDGVDAVSGGLVCAGGVYVWVGIDADGVETAGVEPSGDMPTIMANISTIIPIANAAPNLSTPAI